MLCSELSIQVRRRKQVHTFLIEVSCLAQSALLPVVGAEIQWRCYSGIPRGIMTSDDGLIESGNGWIEEADGVGSARGMR
jgi:hypothetical protein